MDFFAKFLEAHSGTSVPVRYQLWSALSLLQMTLGRKVYIKDVRRILYPGIHICLVGDSSSKKTTAMEWAMNTFIECFPEHPIGASKTSPEELVRFMSSESCERFFEDETGAMVEWRPLASFASEFTDWLIFNPQGMIELLTNMFDAPFYRSDTLKRGKEMILRPYMTILACTVPDKIIRFMKADIIAGGFGRRMLFVYETDYPPTKVFSQDVEGWDIADKWVKDHLLKIDKIRGQFQWTQEAKDYIEDWFSKVAIPKNNILSGYYASKDTIVQKLAMCVAMAQPEPKLLLTKHDIEQAIAMAESNEDNLPKLTIAAGRNELAISQHKLLGFLEQTENKMLPEFVWHKMAMAEVNEIEYRLLKQALKDTKQIGENYFQWTSTERVNIIFTYAKWKELKDKGEIQ